MGRRPSSRSSGPAMAFLCSILLFSISTSAAFQNDFSAYPAGAQSCLYTASDASGCDGNTVLLMNTCLCGNGGNFVLATAKCLGAKSPSDLSLTYTTMSTNCKGSNTPLSVSQAQFLAAASSSSTTTPKTATTTTRTATASTTSRPTTTTTSSASQTSVQSAEVITTVVGGETVTVTTTPTSPPDSANGGGGNGGLSTGAKIGIAAGGIAVGIAILAAIGFCIRRRRKNDKEEARPMLGGQYPDPVPPAETAAFAASNQSPAPSELGLYSDAQKPYYATDNKPPGWRPSSGLTPTPSPNALAPAWQSPQQQVWEARQHQAWGETPTPPPPQQAWAVGVQSMQQQQQQQQQWHQPPTNYAELAQPQDNQGQVYELASMPIQQQPSQGLAHHAVEMPASPLPHPGNIQSYPGQWQR
jgi:hypothetical protein